MSEDQDLPIEEIPQEVPQLTVDDLNLAAGAVTKPVGLKLVQYVEETRDGRPWCSRADAEEMLVTTALASMRGQGGVKATKYAIAFDEATGLMTLTLG